MLGGLRSFDLGVQPTDVVGSEDVDPSSRNSSIMAVMELAALASSSSRWVLLVTGSRVRAVSSRWLISVGSGASCGSIAFCSLEAR